jgi:hypothetical protein
VEKTDQNKIELLDHFSHESDILHCATIQGKKAEKTMFNQMLNCITVMFKQMLIRATIVSPTSLA